MLAIKNLSIVTLLATAATAAAPGLAAADHRDGRWMQLAEVGTHSHDAEDYVEVDTRLQLDRVQLRATDGNVPIDGLRISFADGRTIYADVHRFLRQGEAVMVELPAGGAIKMLTIDYGNHGPYWRARQTAHLEVMAQASDRYDDRVRFRDYRDRDYRAPARVRVQSYQAPYQTPYQAPYQAPYAAAPGFEWRAGVQVRIQ